MKKIKNMLRKGGIADIVTLMIIIGLVIGLIVTVIIPTISDTENTQVSNSQLMHDLTEAASSKANTALTSWKNKGVANP